MSRARFWTPWVSEEFVSLAIADSLRACVFSVKFDGCGVPEIVSDGTRTENPDARHTWSAFPSNDDYQLHVVRWSGPGGDLGLKVENGYGVLIPLRGDGKLAGQAGPGTPVLTGHPLLLPYAAMPMVWTPGNAGEWAVLIPRGANLVLGR